MNDEKNESTGVGQVKTETIDANLLTVGKVDATGKFKEMKISEDKMKIVLRGLGIL